MSSGGNFLAIAVPKIEFKRWFWCGVPLYDQNGHFTGYGCHPEFGPDNPTVLAPWVQQRITESRAHILNVLKKAFGSACP